MNEILCLHTIKINENLQKDFFLAHNETFIGYDFTYNFIIIRILRNGNQLSKVFKLYRNKNGYILYANLKKYWYHDHKLNHVQNREVNEFMKACKQSQIQNSSNFNNSQHYTNESDLIDNVAAELSLITHYKERSKYPDIQKVNKILNAEIVDNPNISDTQIFLFLYNEVFKNNFQATINYLQGYKKYTHSESTGNVVHVIQQSFRYFIDFVKKNNLSEYLFQAEAYLIKENIQFNFRNLFNQFTENIKSLELPKNLLIKHYTGSANNIENDILELNDSYSN
jgi:hypothetical protein